MKTKRFFKSTVSLILAVMMLVSMFTVGIVNTTAAETDVAETGAGTTVYFQNNWKWTDVRIHVYDSSKNALTGNWPGAAMTKVGTSGEYDYYKYTLPTNAYGFVFNGLKDDGSGARDQSPDIETIPTNDHFYYMNWNNGNQCLQANESITVKFPSEGGNTNPTEPSVNPTTSDDPVDATTICFLLNSDTKWVATDDAKMFIKSGSDVIEMDETVDTKSGHIMWTAEVDAHSSYTFYRTSYFFDESNASTKAWNSWTASSRGSNTVFKATSNTGGSWVAASTVNAADPKDIENFWDDLWIDTRGEGKPEHAVKVYYTGSTFHLYVPSYVDLSNVTVYSDHEKVVIGGKEYASGSKASLSTGTKTFAFQDGSTTTNKGNITIYQTKSTAAMLMTTKEELYTGTTAGLASDNAWPSGSGITSTNYNNVYKDAIETKGSYYFYDETGNIVNSDPVLKKIKGRGNSSFEASMRIYGKYAYNFNLDKKVALIDGATESKKWCLLANNVDHTMMRNTFIYSLADDLGLKYAPETRLVDLYDNGKYLGAYVVTEKVEYGKNTLMKDMKNLDDGNTDANSVFTADGEDYLYEFDTDDLNAGTTKTSAFSGTNYTYKYYTTYDRPAYKDESGNTVAAASNLTYNSPADYNTKYNYLLEFELYDRYQNEASWFKSSRTGQAVVVKYPEFATKDEMEWIISEFEEAEAAIYANDTTAIKAAVDVDSFAKMYLLQELAINLDSCATSYYIHNDLTSGKLVSSPVWDYDWAFGAYAGNTKYIYNGSSVVSSANMSDPKQMFVKNKALKTDSGDSEKKANYNFQAKLVHNSYVWERCQYLYTNDMAPALYSYLIDDYSDTTDKGTIVTEWLPKFESSVDMNNARWGAYTKNDDWGTKVTTDYTKGSGLTSSSNFKIGDCSSSGSSSKNFSNTVYYLNDWLVVRKNYLSSSSGGNLWNDELKEEYKIENVTFTGTQDSTDDTKLTITPSATVTKNGEAVAANDTTYTIYVNGKAVYNSNFTETSHTITLSAATNEVYVVVGVKDTDKSAQSESQTFTIYVAEYKVENVKFEAVQSADEATVTVTPAAVVTCDGEEVKPDKINYTIYLNGTAYVTNTFETTSVDVPLVEGMVNEIYVKVTPVENTKVSGNSSTQKFSFNVAVEKVKATLYFKSSGSIRYVPKIIVNKEEVSMTKGDLIGKNASQTQSYYWYTADVEIEKDVATTIAFTNEYSMYASTTLKLSADQTFRFAVDNLNNGVEVVDLTNVTENIQNFKLSASHMVYNDPTSTELATTSINGRILKMGDANEDNKLNITDATAIQRSLAELDTLSETGDALADFNLDGTKSIMDVTYEQIKLAS